MIQLLCYFDEFVYKNHCFSRFLIFSVKMMQQQIIQNQNPNNPQQPQQQMVLCPVRVVYETQILVPPGEQVQPNQTIFISPPQNQPPWLSQNTAIMPQNQMLYVQHTPNQMQPSVQQNIDQNQMYMQQGLSLQQLINNQNMAQQQRPPEQKVLTQQLIQNPQQNVIDMNQYAQMVAMHNVGNVIPNMQQTQMQIGQNIVNFTQNQQQMDNRQQLVQQNNARNLIPNVMQIQQGVDQRNLQQNVVLPQNVVMTHQNVRPNVVNLPQVRQPMQTDARQYQQNINQIYPQHTLVIAQNGGQPYVTNIQRPQMNAMVQQNSNLKPQQLPININKIKTEPNITPTKPQQPKIAINTQMTQKPDRQPMKHYQNPTRMSMPQQQPIHQKPMQQTQPAQQQQQLRQPSMPNLMPMVTQQQPLMQMQNMIPMSSINQIQRPVMTQTRPMQTQIQMQNIQPQIYKPEPPKENFKKRKSESPDEMRKITASCSTQVNFPKMTVVKSEPQGNVNEIGVNTSPVHKPKMQVKIINNDVAMKTEDIKKETNLTEADKLKRNTIFAQARVRKVSNSMETESNSQVTKDIVVEASKVEKKIYDDDLESKIEAKLIIVPPKMENTVILPPKIENTVILPPKIENTVILPPKIENIVILPSKIENTVILPPKIENTVILPSKIENTVAQKAVPEIKITPQKPSPIKIKPQETQPSPVKIERKITHLDTSGKELELTCHKKIAEQSKAKTKKIEQTIDSIGKELVYVKLDKIDRNKMDEKPILKEKIKKGVEIKKETILEDRKDFKHLIDKGLGNKHKMADKDNFVLTHVLDGIVIQESNVAFPIRLPLKERPIPNRPAKDKPQKTEIKEEETSPDKSKKQDEAENINGSDDTPFLHEKKENVKTWSVDELTSYLTKQGWQEAASVLQEHEIDGEALFLVNSSQLIDIGINEYHANILEQFVNS